MAKMVPGSEPSRGVSAVFSAPPPADTPTVPAESAGDPGGGSAGPGPGPAGDGYFDGYVSAALPGFTVIATDFGDSGTGVFAVVNPTVVHGSGVVTPDFNPRFYSIGDDVWCNVTLEGGEVRKAEVADARDPDATVSVHVATITADRVIQYHVGAVIVGGGEAVEPDDRSTEIAPVGEDSAGKLQIKDWGDASTYPSGSDTTLADMLESNPPSQADPHPIMLLARDGGLLPSVCYIPIGNLTLRRVDSTLKVVTAVEWLQGNGPVGHEYSIRVSKQKIIIANGELTLDAAVEYSYIDTVAHSAVYPNGN